VLKNFNMVLRFVNTIVCAKKVIPDRYSEVKTLVILERGRTSLKCTTNVNIPGNKTTQATQKKEYLSITNVDPQNKTKQDRSRSHFGIKFRSQCLIKKTPLGFSLKTFASDLDHRVGGH
jgi:hypothetical protein